MHGHELETVANDATRRLVDFCFYDCSLQAHSDNLSELLFSSNSVLKDARYGRYAT
jgi:hypothetical protein